MSTQHIDSLIIGAGQAGLATGYQLQRRGRECLIVDGVERVGDSWRRHWDSLRLFTPGRYNSLPGLPFPGEARRFPGKDRGNGCVPRVPPFAGQLDPGIEQLHSSEYQRPDQLAAGPTLVVGAADSGCEIAHELAADRPVTRCGRDPGHEPFRPGSRVDGAFVPVFVLLARHVVTRRTPMGRRMMRHFRRHGIPVGRLRAKDLADRGVTRREARVVGVRDGRPVLADGTALYVGAVVWCTGSRPDFGWIDLLVFGDDGWPREYRGVAEDVHGLYFCGLLFQYAVASSVLPGVGRDAAYVAQHITDHTSARAAIAA